MVESFFEMLQRSRRVAVLLRERPSVDAAAAALGWKLLLEAAGHEAHVVAAGGLPAAASFLPRSADVLPDLPPTPLVVRVKTGGATVGKVRYEVAPGELVVHVSPAAGSLGSAEVSAEAGERPFDLIVSIGCPSREDWGPVFSGSRDLLLRCPTACVDVHPGHRRYGQLNVLDVPSASLCVASFALWAARTPDLSWLTPQVATCWYTGAVDATDRFASPLVTPAVLAAAGQLLAAGADRAGAMASLYKRRSVGEVRLWGRALATLEWDAAAKLAWCSVSAADVAASGAESFDAARLLREVSAASPLADVAVLLHERSPAETSAWVAAYGAADAVSLLRQLSPSGDSDVAEASVALPLPEARARVLDEVRRGLAAAAGSSTVPTPAGP